MIARVSGSIDGLLYLVNEFFVRSALRSVPELSVEYHPSHTGLTGVLWARYNVYVFVCRLFILSFLAVHPGLLTDQIPFFHDPIKYPFFSMKVALLYLAT